MSLDTDLQKFLKNLAVNVEKAARVAELEAHRLVAQKEGELDQSIGTDPARIEGSVVKAAFGSELHYAIFVHEGVQNRRFDYRRGSGRNREVVYTGIGQKFLDRAVVRKEEEIFNIIRSTKIK